MVVKKGDCGYRENRQIGSKKTPKILAKPFDIQEGLFKCLLMGGKAAVLRRPG
jgi:hypothetical protein